MDKFRICLDNCYFDKPYENQQQAEIQLTENFDYTEWRGENLFVDITAKELSNVAMEYRKAQKAVNSSE